jgi:SAM-dependent methyltransferase
MSSDRPRLRRLKQPRLLYLVRRRREPLSRRYGRDRGQPVDRYYIEDFLGRHRQDIRGVCLEVGDRAYTTRFGSAVDRSEVLDIDRANPRATILGDLRCLDGVGEETFDCLILTQVLQYMDDVRAAVSECHRILKPGGVMLATMPTLGRIEPQAEERDYWRFTKASANYLFHGVFGPDMVRIEAHGNVLVGLAFWIGMAREELSREDFDYHDPDFPCLITVRAVK